MATNRQIWIGLGVLACVYVAATLVQVVRERRGVEPDGKLTSKQRKAWAFNLDYLAKDGNLSVGGAERARVLAERLRRPGAVPPTLISVQEKPQGDRPTLLDLFYFDEGRICGFRLKQGDGPAGAFDYPLCEDASNAFVGVNSGMILHAGGVAASAPDGSRRQVMIIESPNSWARAWFPLLADGPVTACLTDLQGNELDCVAVEAGEAYR